MCAIGAFSVASLVALSGADWPPPLGFLVLEVLLAGLSSVVYLRVGGRLTNRWTGRRMPPAALEGLLAGLAVGLAMLAFSPGAPGVVPTPGDRMIWFVVMGLAGALAAQAIWAVALAASGRPPSSEADHTEGVPPLC